MKYQDIENEFNGKLGKRINTMEVHYQNHGGPPWQDQTITEFFKTKMKEAMMEIIGEDQNQSETASYDTTENWYRNRLRVGQRQAVNEFFEEEGK